jgi:hypothetical protein
MAVNAVTAQIITLDAATALFWSLRGTEVFARSELVIGAKGAMPRLSQIRNSEKPGSDYTSTFPP